MHPIDAADHVRPLKLVLANLQAGRNDDPPRDYFICNTLNRLCAEVLAILLALAGLVAVIATEPARERAFVTSAERG